MTYVSIVQVLGTLLLVWLGALGALLAYRTLTGQLSATGLLAHDLSDQSETTTPERLQLLVAFLFALGGYVVHALHAPGTPTSLPEVPNALLVLLGGSHAIYLSGKLGRHRRR